jgi:hypothetical protein
MIANRCLVRVDRPALREDDYFLQHGAKGKDGQHVEAILRSFTVEKSVAWDALTRHFSSGIRHRELCSIAFVLSHCFGFASISRDAPRSNPVVIKWFHDNWAGVKPVLSLVALHDDRDGIIDYHRELPAKSSRSALANGLARPSCLMKNSTERRPERVGGWSGWVREVSGRIVESRGIEIERPGQFFEMTDQN